MKLQINTSGAWKNVAEFDAGLQGDVMYALRPLALVLSLAKWALVTDSGNRIWLTFPPAPPLGEPAVIVQYADEFARGSAAKGT